MHTRRFARLALTAALILTTLTATLAMGGPPGAGPSVAHAATCLTCGGDGGSPGTTRASSGYVVMGDSFASGEGGQWDGNPALGSSDYSALRTSDPTTVYGSSWSDPTQLPLSPDADQGCHRSDVAEATAPGVAAAAFNIACSGVTTLAMTTSVKGEEPQIQHLQDIAVGQATVKTIVLSIGGNDLNFAGIIHDCVLNDASGLWGPCNAQEQSTIDANMPTTMAAIKLTIDDIEAAMQQAGYSPSAYRLVLQGYPSPLPAAATMVTSANKYRTSMGCPFYSADADWAHNTFVPEFDANLRLVADDRNAQYGNVQFLDLSHLFDGHEVCSTMTTRPTDTVPPDPATAEWVRELSFAAWATAAQGGYHNESFHPDADGQQAVGHCITLLAALPASGDYTCTGAPKLSPSQVQLASLDTASYRFLSANTGAMMALDGSGFFQNGDPAVQWADNGTPDHNWQLVSEGNGYYKIRNTYTGKILGVAGMSTALGASIVQWDDNGTPDHDWSLSYDGGGAFSIINRNSGLPLNVFGTSSTNGVRLVQGVNNNGLGSATGWQLLRNTTSLVRYYNPTLGYHWVTTGTPDAGYGVESTFGTLSPISAANTRPLYACTAGSWNPNDHFLSFDMGCEGGGIFRGTEGYIYTSPPAGVPSAAVYRCFSGHDHFVSTDPHCEGMQVDTLLGYVRTA